MVARTTELSDHTPDRCTLLEDHTEARRWARHDAHVRWLFHIAAGWLAGPPLHLLLNN